MGSWLQGISKEGPDLLRPGQIFGASHLPRSTETWCRKIQAVWSILTSTSRRHTHEFLRVAEFCQIWIPNFSLLAKPLYEATKGGWGGGWGKREPLIWESDQQQAFHAIKEALVSAPALGLPEVRTPFFLYVHEKWHSNWSPDPIPRLMALACGLFLQTLGFSGKGIASLLASSCSHSLAGIRGRKVNTKER
jgi:hypothetical protein